nr:hypothetical protein [Actinomycetota bacterium]
MKLKGYDVLLLLLAVVTAGAIWLALGSVGSTSAGGDSGGGSPAPQGGATPTRLDDSGEQATATSEPTSPSATPSTSTDDPKPDDQTAPTSDQTDSTSQEPTSAQEPPSSAAETFAQTLAGRDGEPVDVAVLGDDTSNLRTEWAQLWGQELAESREVTVVQ